MTIPTSPAPPLIHLLTSDALPHAPETSNISWAVAGAECNTVIELKPEHHAA